MMLSLLDADKYIAEQIKELEKDTLLESVIKKAKETFSFYASMDENSFIALKRKAHDPNTGPDALRALAEHPSRSIRVEVGKNPSTPFDVRRELFNDKKNYISAWHLIMDKNATPEFLTTVATLEPRRVAEVLLVRDDIPFSALEVLMKRTDLSNNENLDPYYNHKTDMVEDENVYKGNLYHPVKYGLMSPKKFAKQLMVFKIKEFEHTDFTVNDLEDKMIALSQDPNASTMEIACCTLHENSNISTFLLGCEMLAEKDPAKLEIVKQKGDSHKVGIFFDKDQPIIKTEKPDTYEEQFSIGMKR